MLNSFNLPNLNVTLENMMSEWGEIPYSELSIMLVHLRFLALVHQTNHWVSKSDSFYSDHLLFERLYNDVVGEIDSIAEKAIGLGNENNVNVNLQVLQLTKLTQCLNTAPMIPQSNQLVNNSLSIERNFISVIDYLIEKLKVRQMLTLGLENLLAGISDKHEEHVYLLKQRNQ